MKFEVEHGSFHYGNTPILKDICFQVEEGQVMTILGGNGVGKTTLLKCMMGLQKWEKGRTLINNTPISQMKKEDIWKEIAYVPQSKGFSLSYTAFEMVLMGRSSRIKLFAQPTEEDREIAKEALASVGSIKLLDKQCSKMSGGELQMVLIARALASKPKLLILDEPESNLDFKNQLMVLDIIKHLSKNMKIASIVNTHYPSHAMKIADKAFILNRDHTYLYGDSNEIITEEAMRKAFSVEVKIKEFCYKEQYYKSVIPIGGI